MPKKGIELTFEYISSLLHYEPDTGVLRWKVDVGPHGRIKAGTFAGTLDPSGYIKINLDHTPRYAHRIAWLLHHGEWPKHQIDHINMVRSDNRISNLREADNSQNNCNRCAQSNNKSTGIKGVTRQKHGGYSVQIMKNGRSHYFGYFKDLEKAAAVAAQAYARLHKDFRRTS